jgi:hypothetical protein
LQQTNAAVQYLREAQNYTQADGEAAMFSRDAERSAPPALRSASRLNAGTPSATVYATRLDDTRTLQLVQQLLEEVEKPSSV